MSDLQTRLEPSKNYFYKEYYKLIMIALVLYLAGLLAGFLVAVLGRLAHEELGNTRFMIRHPEYPYGKRPPVRWFVWLFGLVIVLTIAGACVAVLG